MKKKTLPATLHPFKLLITAAALSLMSGCVTVNVNFPESAVQKASDDYVRDLYRTKEQGKTGAPKSAATPTSDTPSTTQLLNFLIPTAEAADPTFNLDSPKLGSIKEKLKGNLPDVIEQKKAGVLGETSDGHVTIHDASKLKPLQKKKVDDVVKTENDLRDSLYSEVVSSNHLPSNSAISVRRSFARSFQAESPSGTWVQSEGGSWSQKP